MSVQSEKFALARAENKEEQAKIAGLEARLRKMSQDPKFTNEDREEIARQIRKLMPKEKPKKSRQKRTKRPGHPSYIIDIDTTGLNKGGIDKRYKGGLMVKPKAAKRGY